MSSDALCIDAYFESQDAARLVGGAFGAGAGKISERSLEALAELGFGNAEALRDWFDISCTGQDRKLTLVFEASSGDWEKPLIAFLTSRGANHVLVDYFVGSAGERSEYGYIAGQMTPFGQMIKALRAIDPDVALTEAVQRGRVGDTKKLLEAGADPNGIGRTTHLVNAVRAERPGVVGLLLKAGADVNRQDPGSGETALHRCARLGEHETRDRLAGLLLRHGADPNLPDAKGWSPLLRAANFGSAVLSKALLEHGGNPNARHVDGRTVAMVAAAASNDGLGVLRALEAHGADLAAVDREERGILFHAQPRIKLERYLLERGLARYVPDREYTGDPVADLFTAIRFNHVEHAEELVRDKELANARFNPELEYTFITALYQATANDRDEIVERLLERGADPSEPSGYGTTLSTPLWTAVRNGNRRIACALLGAGADADAGRSGLSTPLMTAVVEDQPEIVRMLLDAGADPRAECQGRNALASVRGSTEEGRAIFELLLERVGLAPGVGYALLQKAVMRDDRWLVQRLAGLGFAVRGSDLMLRDDLESFEFISSLFDGDPSSIPLARCCHRLVKAKGKTRDDQRRIFERLLEMGVECDRTGPTGRSQCDSPLAALQRKKGFLKETRALLAAGADPNRPVPDLLGGRLNGEFAPLHIAAYYGLVDNAGALIEAGADVGLEEREGGHGTALLIAKARGKKKMVELLLKHGAENAEPEVPVGKLSLAEARRRFVQISKTSPYVQLEESSARTPPIDGLAPQLAELFSRYQRVLVFDGPPDEDDDEMGLDAALVGPVEGLDGFLKIGGGGPHYNLLAKPGEESVYPHLIDGPEAPRPYPSFYHWALVQIQWAEMMVDDD